MAFHFINVVWGEAYTDLYLNVVLPTQISPGNLMSFQNERDSVYKIYTTRADAETIVNHPIYSALSDLINTKIKIFNFSDEYFQKESKYIIMNYCHQHAVLEANKSEGILIFLAPDAIFSDGTFAKIKQKAAEGKKAVMVAGPVLNKKTFVPAFHNQFSTTGKLGICVSSRELVKLSLEHIHDMSMCSFWNSLDYHGWPSHIYWDVRDRGILARCFHMHPVMINPTNKRILPTNTVDFYYLEESCPDFKDIYVVEDSDEMAVFEISDKRQYYPRGYGLNEIDEIVDWAKNNTTKHHIDFSKHKIKIHHENISDEWLKIEEETDRIFQQFYQKNSAKT